MRARAARNCPADQTRAGLLMMAEQILTLGMAAALLLWSHVERLEAAADG